MQWQYWVVNAYMQSSRIFFCFVLPLIANLNFFVVYIFQVWVNSRYLWYQHWNSISQEQSKQCFCVSKSRLGLTSGLSFVFCGSFGDLNLSKCDNSFVPRLAREQSVTHACIYIQTQIHTYSYACTDVYIYNAFLCHAILHTYYMHLSFKHTHAQIQPYWQTSKLYGSVLVSWCAKNRHILTAPEHILTAPEDL